MGWVVLASRGVVMGKLTGLLFSSPTLIPVTSVTGTKTSRSQDGCVRGICGCVSDVVRVGRVAVDGWVGGDEFCAVVVQSEATVEKRRVQPVSARQTIDGIRDADGAVSVRGMGGEGESAGRIGVIRSQDGPG